MSPDLTMCSPPRLTKKCATCYRRTATPDKWQSYANLSNPCRYMPKPEYRMREGISATEYNKRMDKIIARGGTMPETMIALLDEANKYHIVDVNKKVKSAQKDKYVTKT